MSAVRKAEVAPGGGFEVADAEIDAVILEANDNPEGGVALFLKLQNVRAQRDAIRACGEAVLPREKFGLLNAILTVFEAAAKERSALAHGIFGFSFDIPDVLEPE